MIIICITFKLRTKMSLRKSEKVEKVTTTFIHNLPGVSVDHKHLRNIPPCLRVTFFLLSAIIGLSVVLSTFLFGK